MRGIPVDGDTLRRLRRARAWSQQHLAAVADCTVRTVRSAERGKAVHAGTLSRIAAALETSLHTLAARDTCERNAQRNLELIRAWHDDYLYQDIGGLLARHHRESHTEIPGTENMPAGGPSRGLAEHTQHYEAVFQIFPVIDLPRMPIDAVGDLVFARPVATLRSALTGETFTQPHVNQFRIVDGKISHRITYQDLSWHRQNVAYGGES